MRGIGFLFELPSAATNLSYTCARFDYNEGIIDSLGKHFRHFRKTPHTFRWQSIDEVASRAVQSLLELTSECDAMVILFQIIHFIHLFVCVCVFILFPLRWNDGGSWPVRTKNHAQLQHKHLYGTFSLPFYRSDFFRHVCIMFLHACGVFSCGTHTHCSFNQLHICLHNIIAATATCSNPCISLAFCLFSAFWVSASFVWVDALVHNTHFVDRYWCP